MSEQARILRAQSLINREFSAGTLSADEAAHLSSFVMPRSRALPIRHGLLALAFMAGYWLCRLLP